MKRGRVYLVSYILYKNKERSQNLKIKSQNYKLKAIMSSRVKRGIRLLCFAKRGGQVSRECKMKHKVTELNPEILRRFAPQNDRSLSFYILTSIRNNY